MLYSTKNISKYDIVSQKKLWNYVTFSKQTWNYSMFSQTNFGIMLYFQKKKNLELWHMSKNKSGLTSPGEHDGQGRQALTEPTQGRPALDIY